METKEQDSSYSGRDKDKAIIPASTFKAIYGQKYVDNFIFQVLDPTRGSKAQEGGARDRRAQAPLRPERRGGDPDVGHHRGDEVPRHLLPRLPTFLGVVGALTLVVGGIGVSNIMNVVVEERTKEIGIKMALGAKRRYVVGQFLFETLLITIVGGDLRLRDLLGRSAPSSRRSGSRTTSATR